MSAQRQVGKDEMRFWYKAKGKRPRRRRLGPHPHRRKKQGPLRQPDDGEGVRQGGAILREGV